MSTLIRHIATAVALLLPLAAFAQGNLEINTPAISSLKGAMQSRHGQLAPFYASGAVGIARDGSIVLRDANAIPVAQRQSATGVVGGGNNDRGALYRVIARANGHPEWEAEVRSTFGQRWADKAQPGWFVQNTAGQWSKK